MLNFFKKIPFMKIYIGIVVLSAMYLALRILYLIPEIATLEKHQLELTVSAFTVIFSGIATIIKAIGGVAENEQNTEIDIDTDGVS